MSSGPDGFRVETPPKLGLSWSHDPSVSGDWGRNHRVYIASEVLRPVQWASSMTRNTPTHPGREGLYKFFRSYHWGRYDGPKFRWRQDRHTGSCSKNWRDTEVKE